ncbi:MAG: hypothetical protein ACOCVF_02760 [bacterium]
MSFLHSTNLYNSSYSDMISFISSIGFLLFSASFNLLIKTLLINFPHFFYLSNSFLLSKNDNI